MIQAAATAATAAALALCAWAAPAAAQDDPQAPTFAMRPQGWAACRSGGGGQTEARGVELVRNGGFEFGQSGWLARERRTDPSGASPPAQADISPDLTSSAAYLSPDALASTPPAQRQGLGLSLRLPYGVPRERFVSQSLDTPVELTGLTVRFRYRIEQAYPDGSPTRMRALIQRVRSQDEIWSRDFSADLSATPDASPLEDGWLQFEASISDLSALADMSGSRATPESGPLVLRVVAIGQGMVLHLDDVSVKADGLIDWPDAPGRIAYAVERPGRAPGYAVQCVSPNGQGRSELFLALGNLEGLRWRPRPLPRTNPNANPNTDPNTRPDAAPKPPQTAAQSALALVSSHDPAFSNWRGEVYLLDAQSLRRLTHPHTPNSALTAASAAGAPTGRVRGLLHNPAPTFQTVQVHVQGATAPAMLTLRPQETAAFELAEVADLGAVEQFVVVRTRRAAFEAPWRVDVKARAAVDLPAPLEVSAAYTAHSVGQVTFDPSGDALLLTSDDDTLARLPIEAPNAQPIPLSLRGTDPRPSPTDSRLLFVDTDPDRPTRRRLFLWDAAQPNTPPQPIAAGDNATQTLDHPTWLPDGSGFLYRAIGCPDDASQCSTSLHLYSFPIGASRRIALFPDEEISGLTVSPDGQYMAFIRAMRWTGFNPKTHQSLWIMSLQRPTQRWLIDASDQPSLPDWSRD